MPPWVWIKSGPLRHRVRKSTKSGSKVCPPPGCSSITGAAPKTKAMCGGLRSPDPWRRAHTCPQIGSGSPALGAEIPQRSVTVLRCIACDRPRQHSRCRGKPAARAAEATAAGKQAATWAPCLGRKMTTRTRTERTRTRTKTIRRR
jgi:hypothetical protein